jgi:hypothetical protein
MSRVSTSFLSAELEVLALTVMFSLVKFKITALVQLGSLNLSITAAKPSQ